MVRRSGTDGSDDLDAELLVDDVGVLLGRPFLAFVVPCARRILQPVSHMEVSYASKERGPRTDDDRVLGELFDEAPFGPRVEVPIERRGERRQQRERQGEQDEQAR